MIKIKEKNSSSKKQMKEITQIHEQLNKFVFSKQRQQINSSIFFVELYILSFNNSCDDEKFQIQQFHLPTYFKESNECHFLP